MDHHVISERVLLPQHLAADVAGVFLLQEYLVLVGHVAILGGLPPVPGTDGAQPLFMGDLLELCNSQMNAFWGALQGDHSACAKSPVDFKTKVALWPGQQLLFFKSTGGFAQAEWSPCMSNRS